MSIKLLRGASLTLAALAVSLAIAAPVSAAPGNNGTIKIDREAFDDHPNNEPHVGCIFQVDFYGYDEGNLLFADVTFVAQAPSGKNIVLLEDTVFIGEDDAGGGGSEGGLDASVRYDLSDSERLDEIAAHAKQGYHVKLTINADGSQGADTKHKVFWVTECDPCDPKDPPEYYPEQ